ncbi:MAG TPA: hypothetical protein VGK39_09190 [Cyclobacteriaceae bacterium]
MKTAVYLSLVLLINGCASVTNKPNDIVKIEFSSLTRGHSRNIIFTKDSVISSVEGREASPKKEKRLNAEEWQRLVGSLKNLALNEITDLQSPTMKRAYDGAMHSTIVIATSDRETFSHSFDDEDPHEKLKPLMKVIHELND